MKSGLLITFNPGSSTIKIGLFSFEAPLTTRRLGNGMIELRHEPLMLRIEQGDETTEVALASSAADGDIHDVIDEVLSWLKDHPGFGDIAAVGHRVVHGGDRFQGPARLTDEVIAAIEELVPLAPLHQPHSLGLIRTVGRLLPDLVQVASFDTAFHRTQEPLASRFAIPRALHDAWIAPRFDRTDRVAR